MPVPNLSVSESSELAATACAEFIRRTLGEALRTKSFVTLGISGGTTPKLLFGDLAKSSFDWDKVHLFWVDERCVAPTEPQSNFKLANDIWLTPASYPAANIHRVFGELEPAEGGAKYASEIKEFFGLEDGEMPVFDLLHRGMGSDCHTASLFPGEPLIENRIEVATNVWVEKTKMHRVTLLPGVLLAARKTVLQVSGADKADAVKTVIEGAEDWLQYPCQMASRDENANWFLDRAAAAKL